MSITAEIMAKKIEDLSESIGKASKSRPVLGSVSNDLDGIFTSSQENILLVFQLNEQKVVFTLEKNNQIQTFLERGDKRIIIPREDINGIPKECFSNPDKMKGVLLQSHLNITECSDNKGFKITANLKLLGGGHLGRVGTGRYQIREFWEVNDENKILIPYQVNASSRAAYLWNSGQAPGANEIDIIKEFEAARAIFGAIEKWNRTDLVELSNLIGSPLVASEYQQKYGNRDAGRVQFSTTISTKLCQSSCMGRCPITETQLVVCDLSGVFREHSEQSILHEIGHVIGLAHEHTRNDRNDYVDTDLPDPRGRVQEQVGGYDVYSVMHYAFGNYRIEIQDDQYLDCHLNPQPNFQVQYPGAVGRREVISHGDKEAVKELRTLYSQGRR